MENMYDSPQLELLYRNGPMPDIDAQAAPGQHYSSRIQFFGDYIILRVPKFRAVLDAGCATGFLGAILKEHRPDLLYTGLDPSAALLALGRETFGPDLRLVRGSIEQLPIKENGPQIVLCAGTLWYCPDVPGAIYHLYRAASRMLFADIVFLPDRDHGVITTQRVAGLEQQVTLFGNKDMVALLSALDKAHPFKDLREGHRFMHYPVDPEAAGLHELRGETVQGFCAVFEKRISEKFTDIFNRLAADQPGPGDPAQ
jgi:SAM-dependent methyltransferase